MERNKLLITAIKHYGAANQISKAIEECGELVRALARMILRANPGDSKATIEAYNNLAEEIADVEIMLEQVKLMIPGIHRDIEIQKEFKLIRLEKKLRGSNG